MPFKRVAMEGDRSTQAVIEEYHKKNQARTEVAMEETDDMDEPEPVANSGEGPPVVIWISIPGFRGDYLEKAETPFFDELVGAGASTNKMRPNFPPLTFPAHATMATGRLPKDHGIIADKIRTGAESIVDQPANAELLLAEPIWETATRQGITTLVHDWPLSQNQAGETAAAKFLTDFDPEATDEARLNKALEDWRAASSAAESPEKRVRLVMLRLTDILKAGLANGPREEGTYTAIGATDTALKSFSDTIQGEWETIAPPAANLIYFITTDHGLAELDKNVNIGQLLGDEMMANADVVAHDAIANLYFKDLPESEGEQKLFIENFDGELSKRIYFRTIKKEELPEEWHYQNERTGDRILVLKTGYSFTDQTAEEPVFDPADGPNLFGGFGYPVEESIRMSGQVILAGIPNSPETGSLGEISQQSFHATVAKMLGIEPAEGAATDSLVP
ncbi:MAG: nucleotide pyrophosphatase/phosphodiesterase family protein [Verrucomicrobiota bacterium]